MGVRLGARLAKQLEGWQVGALLVFIVAVVTAVIVPRTALPEQLPPPNVTSAEMAFSREKTYREAVAATEADLSPVVQLVGARIRALGRAEYQGDETAVHVALNELRVAADSVGRRGEVEQLVPLRSYQARLFSLAYCEFLRTGTVSEELIELGGGVLEEFERNEWLTSITDAPPHADLVLSAFFKRRFTRLVAPGHPALEPDGIEERLLLGYLLEHPQISTIPGTLEERTSASGDFVMRKIDELALLEPEYPVLYAKGIVLFKMQKFESAALAFDAFIQENEDGPYRMRAINYFKASIEHTEGAP